MEKSFEPWAHYWQTMNSHACVRVNDGEYREELESVWKPYFSKLAPNSKVLDVCVGNGAVSRMAVQVSIDSELSHEVTAVDGASINKEYVERDEWLGKVNFVDETNIEQLPFSDQPFYLIVSQYGIEYTNTSVTLPEIARVLKQSGELVIVAHDKEGLSVIAAQNAHDYLISVLDKSRFFSVLKAYLEHLCLERKNIPFKPSDALLQLDKELIKAKKIVEQGYQSVDSKDIAHNVISVVGHMLSNHQDFELDDMLAKVSDIENALEMHRKRLNLCIESALDQESLANLFDIVRSIHLKTIKNEVLLDSDNQIIARLLHFKKISD
ncbi:class I SAM-dependent methyltransferase [Paraneptunicella aestuarii]|uniref:class I SAM-dependent methyltransferase n=1 Tax=Paraneptunicella aestuarii TaxID=2831148 RepID=UPI001E530271|nr:class I SAM-dependent methyltransferase [Paraneptunicella aestuarii]UAA37778.1 class I SAM-dependent methyltransferase [Paraneptunicella aestuarii]